MIPILVTGGAGYIGSHCCKLLARNEFLPVTLDNLSRGHEEFVRWGPLVKADIGDADQVAETIRAYGIKAVLHFAAFAYVGESVQEPATYFKNNVVGTLGLLDGMAKAGCKTIVFSSSCAIYGEPNIVPITESCTKSPVNPYGRSKLMCEDILADYHRAYGLNHISLRYFNACGADPDADIGELRDTETHLIPRALMALQGYTKDFAVFGSDFPTPDGTAIRDYIHVCDLANAHIAAIRLLLSGERSGAFNLGTGQGYSVKNVLDTIERVTGRQLAYNYAPRRDGDPAVLIADASRAKSALNFTPTFSDLETIIRSSWMWHQKAHPIRKAEAIGG
jgi:UDP-arabinose 4-epimerase